MRRAVVSELLRGCMDAARSLDLGLALPGAGGGGGGADGAAPGQQGG